jgi:hypothetical protein
MARRRRVGKKARKGRRRRGGATNKILSGISSAKKVMGALGVRKAAASLGKLGLDTGMRLAKSRASMLR